MQSQEASTDYLFKLSTWFDANLKTIIVGGGIFAVALFFYSYHTYRQSERANAAAQALTQASLSANVSDLAGACLKIATDYPGTAAGQHALLQGATALFITGQYADAQVQFQRFLDMYPDNFFAPQAALGVAASLDALGKTDLAVGAYEKAASQTTDENVAASAKFSLARIDEAQGKSADAAKMYGEIARTYGRTSLGSEAGLRAMELNLKLPKAPAATTPAANAPFKLSN